jgi:hypothetical protein
VTASQAALATRDQFVSTSVRSGTAKGWSALTMILIVGYLTTTRSFAYLGLPTLGVPIPIYIGEFVLFAFLITKSRVSVSRWFSGLVRHTPLSAVSWSIYFFILFGIFEVVRGAMLDGNDWIIALQNLVFNYYALFFFVGLWIAEQYPDLLRKCIRILAWSNGIYGIAWILALGAISLTVPGGRAPLFSQPAGTYVAILGLIAFEKNLRKVRIPLILCAFVLLGLQVRGGWAAFVTGLFTWAIVTKKFGRLAIGVASIGLLLAVSLVFDLRLPANEGQNRGEISARNIAGAAIAPFNEDVALSFTDKAERHSGTTEWRRDWWSAIWRSVHDDPVRTLIGHGYGFTIADLVLFLEGRDDLRTPHNFFMYALGYGGWIGVLLFFSILGTIGRLLWRSYKLTDNPFGLVFVGTALGVAAFGVYFETPFGAIPFFLIVGMACAPAVVSLESKSSLSQVPPAQVT